MTGARAPPRQPDLGTCLDDVTLPDSVTQVIKRIAAAPTYIANDGLRHFGMCVPASCSLEAASRLALQYALPATCTDDARVSKQDLSEAVSSLPWWLPQIPMSVQDPSTGTAIGRSGRLPSWLVPLTAVRGVDFVSG